MNLIRDIKFFFDFSEINFQLDFSKKKNFVNFLLSGPFSSSNTTSTRQSPKMSRLLFELYEKTFASKKLMKVDKILKKQDLFSKTIPSHVM